MLQLSGSAEHDGLRYYYEVACTLSRSDAKRILQSECEGNALYEEAWAEAEYLYQLRREQHPMHPWYLMKKEYFVAIMCYMSKRPNVSCLFNEWCRSAAPTHESWRRFPFKSLFFFLIKAFCYLPPYDISQVYRADPRFPVNEKKKVPFVQFLSASPFLHQALKFGSRLYVLVLLDIPAPLIRDVSMYSCFPKCKEVIIWPFCVFSIVSEQYAVKTLVFDPKRSWIEPFQVTVPRFADVLLPASNRSTRGPAIEPSTSGVVSDVESAECHRMFQPKDTSSLDVAGAKRANNQGKESECAAVHSAPGTSSTETSTAAAGRDVPQTPAPSRAAWRTSADRLRNIIDEIRRDFVITIPCQRRASSPDMAAASGAPGRGVDAVRATSSGESLAVGETHERPDNAGRWRQVVLSMDEDTDESKIPWMRIAAVVCMALTIVSCLALILKRFF